MSIQSTLARRMLVAVIVALALASSTFAQTPPQIATVTFLHLNDVYEISPKQGRGGFAPLMTMLKQERATAPDAITTLGGDLIASSMMSGITKGTQMIELMNAIGLDVAVVGNHEFDFGAEVLKQRAGESKFPWLGTNVQNEDGKVLAGLVPTVTRKVGDVTIGFFGIITPDTRHLSNTEASVKFLPVLDTARAAVKQLKDQGADTIVALTHLTLAQDRELAREIKGVDIILGGHDHDPMTVYEGGVFILKVGADAHYLGVAKIQIEKTQTQGGPQVRVWPREWRVVSTAGVVPDPAIAAIVKQYEDKLDESLKVAVGTTVVELDSRRATVRLKESSIGNLIADAIRDATKADVAITNGGGIRGDRTYAAGTTLTRKDILTELPFGNVTVTMEHHRRGPADRAGGGRQPGRGRGRPFPARVWHDLRFRRAAAAGQPGTRGEGRRQAAGSGRDLPAGHQRVHDGRRRRIRGLTKGKPVVDASGGPLMANVVMDYITARGSVSPGLEGRIVEQK